MGTGDEVIRRFLQRAPSPLAPPPSERRRSTSRCVGAFMARRYDNQVWFDTIALEWP